jgi:hypothetical protein
MCKRTEPQQGLYPVHCDDHCDRVRQLVGILYRQRAQINSGVDGPLRMMVITNYMEQSPC